MEQVDFTIRRDGDCYHIERLWGEAKVRNSGDDSIHALKPHAVKPIGGRVCRDGDESDARIWDAARRVFDKSTGHLDFAADTSVTVERDPDSGDGRDLAVVQLDLPAFLDSGERVDDCDVELLFDLDARQPDSQMCDAIILLVDWMVKETARQTKISQSS